MTIRLIDNFSMYHAHPSTYTSGDGVDLTNGLYASTTFTTGSADSITIISNDPDGTSTGNVCRLAQPGSSSFQSNLRFVLPSTQNVVGCAMRFWYDQLPSDDSVYPVLFSWRDDLNIEIACVTMDTTGRLVIRDGSRTVLTRTSAPVLTADAWYHVELKLTYGVSGNVIVKVEGATVLNFSHSFNTNDSATAQVAWMSHGNSPSPSYYMYIKDVVVWDGAGTVNNDFLGRAIVYSCIPNTDNTTTWTPTGVTNRFDAVADAPYDNTKFISAPTPAPAAQLFGVTPLPTTVTTVLGVQSVVRAKKSDGGDGSLQVSLKSGVSLANGVNRPITTAYTYWADVSELDPATSTAWTRTSVNASLLQLNRTA